MEVYLVGGAVRDLLMGIEPKDKDYVVINSSREEMLELGYEEVGKGFPVFLHPDTGYEYALARKERRVTKEGLNAHQSFEFETEYVTLEEDLFRRDITINSIAMDEKTGVIYDPFGGTQHLKEKKIVHTSDAFIEDPLRVLRVARFNAKFPSFSIDKTTLSLMHGIASTRGFKELPVERVFKEFVKALECDKPSMFLKVLQMSASVYHFRAMFDASTDFRAMAYFKAGMYTMDSVSELTKDVKIRYLAFCSEINNPQRFGEAIKAPANWIADGIRIHSAFLISDVGDRESMGEDQLRVFKLLNAFGNSSCLDAYLLIAEAKGYYEVDFIRKMFEVASKIDIGDIGPEFKGYHIANEFDRLRTKEIERCILTY